jgi:hypothetical protein
LPIGGVTGFDHIDVAGAAANIDAVALCIEE